MNRAYCPDCDGSIIVNPHARVGLQITCPHCDADLQVVGIDPLELDWADDWDDDEDDGIYEDDDY